MVLADDFRRHRRTTPHIGPLIRKDADVADALKQQVAIPAYFRPGPAGTDDWGKAESAGALLGIVVVNPASGPGYTPPFRNDGGVERTAFQSRIEQMRGTGANVLGYVTTNYRDSRGTTVQPEHRFTVTAGNVVMTRHKHTGAENETGWWTGFGPIQVSHADPMLPGGLPGGLAASTDYWWIAESATTGSFAATEANAMDGMAIPLGSAGKPGPKNKDLSMGLSRNSANVENVHLEIDEYYDRWPSIDGIFFDEMNDIGDADDIDYYKRIFDYVKTKDGKALVVQNPGKNLPESLVAFADTFMSFENERTKYVTFDPAPWQMDHPPTKFWHAIYACPENEMPSMIELSREKRAGYVYVTQRNADDDAWKHIASYFAAEVAKIQDEDAGTA